MTNNYFLRFRPMENYFIPKGATSSYYAPTFLCLTVRDSTGMTYFLNLSPDRRITDQLKIKRWEI